MFLCRFLFDSVSSKINIGGTILRPLSFAITLLLITLTTQAAVPAQEDKDDGQQKAEALIQKAIRARGGDAYLTVRSIIGEGQYTPYQKGVSTLPQSFTDYIVYPSTERTDFGKGKQKYIQTNRGNEGWIYDGQQKAIREQTEDQVKNFQHGMRHDLDNLLRREWKEPGAKLVYIGRREVWHNTFSEAIRLEFAEGESVTLHFDTREDLPLMIEFKTVGEEGTTNDQIRYYRWIDYNGVRFPTIQDTYREGQQSSRVNYESVKVNPSLPDKLFDKPADIKEVK